MLAQLFAAFVQVDGFVQRDFAAFQAPHHIFQSAQRVFEGQIRNVGSFVCHDDGALTAPRGEVKLRERISAPGSTL